MLINAGLRAVREASVAIGKPIRVMLHIAQPENAESRFAAATKAGVTDYDIIGLSYYRKWSKEPVSGLTATIARLREAYGKSVVLVGTAYPATPKGQTNYMIDLTQAVIDAASEGVVYWAPDWITSACSTPKPNNWENAGWFDRTSKWEVLPVTNFLDHVYSRSGRDR